MAANFWLSSHANYHLYPRSSVTSAREEDLRFCTEEEIAWIEIWGANAIQKICKRGLLRQSVTATAVTFLRRFYLRNSYCDTDVWLVIAACCYVAAKAEETPQHVRNVMQDARTVFLDMGHTSFPSDAVKLAEMEFYLLEELDFHLIVYHPYRTLVQLCGRDGGDLLSEKDRKERAKMCKISNQELQMAWFIINDTFRSSLCLIYSPHLIAVAALYLTFSLHPPASMSSPNAASNPGASPSGRPVARRRSSLGAAGSSLASAAAQIASMDKLNQPFSESELLGPGGQTDPITFLASLDVDLSLVLEITQEIVALYETWNRFEASTTGAGAAMGRTPEERVGGLVRRMVEGRRAEIASGAAAATGRG